MQTALPTDPDLSSFLSDLGSAHLGRASDDDVFREVAARRGRDRARLFTWEAAARRTRELFEEALA